MHELTVARNILNIVETYAQKNGYHHVHTVEIEIGELSCISSDSLLFCFDVVTKDSVAEHAQLKIIPIPGEGECEFCQHRQAMQTSFAYCNSCNKPITRILQGEEMQVKAIEVNE